ncbi:metallophosphoesterase (plasmid) [Cereibacter azotoformans]|uniref:metallophosphoesterase n=1 Tax=Cereibacter azotoformans TaxID=43057 RepID=UPI000E36079A|nr:metallophosphoesterase [Cereibacter azotoformans]AXQ96076.1 hypothetical protein D0Z66_20325 [Cereibacter sphaeroides]UIJ32915.1 metallophosphoesterase [Cereibacter azotoformans]
MAHFFTADPHFGHEAVIAHEQRPFASVEAMNEALVSNYAAAMTVRDDLWILGDFVHGANVALATMLLERIPGRKHLVRGNHDRSTIAALPGWASVTPYREMVIDRQPLTLCHYPMACWNGSHIDPADGRGSVQLFGHVHGLTRGWWRCVNVAVEVWDWKPASLADIIARSSENCFATPLHEDIFPARRRVISCATCHGAIDRGRGDGGYRWDGPRIVTFRGHPVLERIADWPARGPAPMASAEGTFCSECLEVALAYGDATLGQHYRFAPGVTLDKIASGSASAAGSADDGIKKS